MKLVRFHRTKCVCICLAALVVLTMFIVLIEIRSFPSIYYILHPRDNISCYDITYPSLPNVLDDEPRKGRSIFFHETSCHSYNKGRISITSRQACAVESAARMNPNMDVYLLYTSSGIIEFRGDESDKFLRALSQYKNVKLRRVLFSSYAKGTPVEDLYISRHIHMSDYALSHASDVLRYLTLWKYGGIYLDLDVVVIKPFKDFLPNFAGSESDKNVAAGVMGFSPTGVGHELATLCLEDLKNNFNGQVWGYNGPGVITRLLKNICGVEDAKDMINQECRGFHVFPKKQFYVVPWPQWNMYFEENSKQAVFNMSKDSTVIHVWNKVSSGLKIPLESTGAYMDFAQKFCPKVVQNCVEFF